MRPAPCWAAILILPAAVLHASAAGADAGGAGGSRPLIVFAAASLTESFKAIGAAFERTHAGLTVQFNFAGSSTLALQIAEGAPADVFAAADEASMQKLADTGALAGGARLFASNRLAIVTPAGNPKHLGGLADLGRGGLTLALAAPAVPAGQYATEAFAKAGMTVPAASQEPDVKAVLNKVALGEADAGIVYVTDARAAAGRVEAIAIPDQLNVVARYPIAALRRAGNPADARAFVDFVLAPAARRILDGYGFIVP
jgi:molybdate transport system substrate-binding protein